MMMAFGRGGIALREASRKKMHFMPAAEQKSAPFRVVAVFFFA